MLPNLLSSGDNGTKMDYDPSLHEDTLATADEVETGYGMSTVIAMVDTSIPNVASNKDKPCIGQTSRQDFPNQEEILKEVVDAMKVLSTKVADMEAVNKKMLRILVGMARLQIESPDATQHQKHQLRPIDDDWVSLGNPVEPEREVNTTTHDAEFEDVAKGCNLYDVLQSVTKDLTRHEDVETETNSDETTHITSTAAQPRLPMLTGISTVMVDDDVDGDTSDHLQSRSIEKYENKAEYTKGQNLQKGKTKLLFDSETTVVETLSEKNLSSNYRRFSNRQADILQTPLVAKKLSFTPSPSSYKRQKNETPRTGKSCLTSTPHPGGESIQPTSSQQRARNYKFNSAGAILPKYVKCTFRPTVEMRLSKEEAILCAYMFRENPASSNDLVFGVGNSVLGMRCEFQKLIPGGCVGGPIITMMASRVTWIQRESMTADLWCLHPAFATDVLNGYSIDKLEIFYRRDWMIAYKTLKLVYVPIEDDSGHWFLMVIHIEERKLYHLDSHLVVDKIQERHHKMRKIAGVMSDLLLMIYNCDVGICLLPDFHNWDIIEPRGVPNCGHSHNSGLWVTEWLNMQSSFNNQIVGVMNDKIVRMKIAMRLLVGPHNNCKSILEVRSKTLWDKIMAGVTC